MAHGSMAKRQSSRNWGSEPKALMVANHTGAVPMKTTPMTAGTLGTPNRRSTAKASAIEAAPSQLIQPTK